MPVWFRKYVKVLIAACLVVSFCLVEADAQTRRKRRTRRTAPAAPKPVITNPTIAPPESAKTPTESGDVKIISTADSTKEASSETLQGWKPKVTAPESTEPDKMEQTITNLSTQVNRLNDKLTQMQEDGDGIVVTNAHVVAGQDETFVEPEGIHVAAIEQVKDAGLRGRGGAGFPTGMKWGFIPQDNPKPKYLVVNADESEPGTCKDIPLMMASPHTLVEGVIISSYAIRANKAFIYIRGEVLHVIRRVQAAVEEAYAAGHLGLAITVTLGLVMQSSIPGVLRLGAGALVLVTLGVVGGLLDGRQWARSWEGSRLVGLITAGLLLPTETPVRLGIVLVGVTLISGLFDSRAYGADPALGVVLGVATDPLIHPGMALVHIGQLDKTLPAARAYVAAGGDLGHVRWKPPPRHEGE